jgi:predicted glycoside hydrolase/deacetylase ChbG (UPF0249 family)
MVYRLIVTADDFGLSEEINTGIIEAFQNGIVTSTSLLMNAPDTSQAITLAKKYPKLEVGIHLGIVEGFSLLERSSTISDPICYLNDRGSNIKKRICLHRHWRPFVKRYLMGRINLGDLREELTRQCYEFKKAFPHLDEIPFANGTQHLHLLPGISEIVLELCHQFNIRSLRIPGSNNFGGRFPFDWILGYLGKRFRNLIQNKTKKITLLDQFLGFEVSGRLDESYIQKACQWITGGSSKSQNTYELMTHPGHEAPNLREDLPWAYKEFFWEKELKTLTDPQTKELLRSQNIKLIQFKDLYDAPS